MAKERHKQTLGVILILVGLLFLFVSNRLFLGWGDVWPLFPLLGGIFFLKLYSARKESGIIFIGTALSLLGAFFLLFTSGLLEWSRMETLWPTLPLIGGIAFLAVSGTRKYPTSPFVVGLATIIFAIVGYLYTGNVISRRVTGPFVRLWPLILIITGIVVFLKSRQQTEDLSRWGEVSLENSGKNSRKTGLDSTGKQTAEEREAETDSNL